MRVFSFGGGVQSNAVLVLAAQGKVQYDAFVFANVGEDSENPDTLDYVAEFSIPFAKSHGINLVEVHAKLRGERETLYGRIVNPNKKSTPIPVYGSVTGAPMPRRCTEDFKIIPIAQWIRKQGCRDVTIGLGISLDEIHRATNKPPKKVAGVLETLEYPLIDRNIRRDQCMTIIREAGLPVPPRSACFFCPYHSPKEWMLLKEKRPDLFQTAVEMERVFRAKEDARKQIRLSKYGEGDNYFLHSRRITLDKAVGDQMSFFDELENCESGYCMI